MAIGFHSVGDRVTGRVSAALERIFEGTSRKDFAVRVGDMLEWRPPDAEPPKYTFVIAQPHLLRRVFLQPTELSLGEAYIHGELDLEGSLVDAFGLVDDILGRPRTIKEQMVLAARLMALPSGPVGRVRGAPKVSGARHSPQRDRQAIAYHYDLPPEFYALWLDPAMVYSCAYFRRPEDDLATAQEQKLALVCRKLRLKPGQRMLDLGCGWGGLVIHAAKRHGVHATGVTLSDAQARRAQARIATLGLADRCRVIHGDYRMFTPTGDWDAVATVGMFEHVGEANLPRAMQQVYGLLKPGGAFLLHGITRRFDQPIPRDSFAARYVFPDGELVPINTLLRAAESVGFELRDVEELREHYSLTCRHWLDRLTARRTEALAYVDETTFRIWRLYLAGSVHQFEIGTIHLHQSLLVKPDAAGRSGVPLTREDWYRERTASSC
jgi:cyclopropane-fatty-acyl-phospholipid synthase